MSEYPYITLPKGPLDRLLGAMINQATSEKEVEAFRAFCKKMNDDQAKQLLDLDGFTEPCKIPIWDDELGGPAHDANSPANGSL